MSVLGKTSHALFFNGVTDSIICPQSAFSSTGRKVGDTARSSSPVLFGDEHRQDQDIVGSVLNSFMVEAWVTPDCGGVVASKEDMFDLRVGDVHQPGPASFTVQLMQDNGSKSSVRVTTAVGGTGVLYPKNVASFITSDNDLSKNTRELIHVVGAFTGNKISLYINGDLVAYEEVVSNARVQQNSNDFFIGGQGGQYRGYIESVHWRRGFNESFGNAKGLIRGADTLGLWRFKEPVEVDSNIFHIKSNATVGATTLTFDATQVQTMYQAISGKSDTFSGTYTLPSLGNYQVFNTLHSGGAQVITIAHTTHNLLINPTCTDIETGEPNGSAPERVRLLSLSDSGSVTVSSIHLDFDTTANTGSRGVLCARTAFNTTNRLANDSTAVLIKSDLLIDAGSGKPLQPIGLGSQAIDRTGGMVIDESGNNNHGFLFSRRISVNNSNNPYTVESANWTHGDQFQSGHTGRHYYSHQVGHPYLRFFPQSNEETITRTMDGLADEAIIEYEGQPMGLKDLAPVNAQVDVFRQSYRGGLKNTITSSSATQVIRNGMVSITAADDGIIAIGGSGFDVRPFLLKGHGTNDVVATDDVYNLHMTPESESRVAILETGDSDFPYVEIHYNAIDLLGTTMGTSGPCLIVEKTVPHAGALINSKRVGATIASSISSGRTIHAPGGIMVLRREDLGNVMAGLKSHSLVGDNTGGNATEIELDTSMIPSNYTPSVATDPPNQGPIGVNRNLDNTSHPSVYHRAVLNPQKNKSNDPPEKGEKSYRRAPTTGTQGSTSQSSNTYEVFDIIDNYTQGNDFFLIVQPSVRKRSMQLSKVATRMSNKRDPSLLTIEYLQMRGRISNMKMQRTPAGNLGLMSVTGLMDDVAGTEVNITGDGSPNSHLIKELSPDAPVVTVTLGGPGQGAVNTKPTWDPSVLSRLGWSTRKDCAVRITNVVAASPGQIDVVALNNESDALASWGTYCFPPRGRVYLESGANAEYYKTDADSIFFYGSSSTGTGRFINADGSEADTYAAWTGDATNAVSKGKLFLLDPLFDEESVCNDGTTINDRMFQSLGSVTHDYQLGTQYASTRALVEIPLFPQQFFEDRDAGIFPGPDNSMKLHLDATLTAHTWAPNPVGRRCNDLAPADREVMASYHRRWIDGDDRHSVRVVRVDRDTSLLHIDNIERLPDSNPDNGLVRFAEDDMRIRRLFRANGEWMIYTQLNRTNKTVLITGNPLEVSTDFFKGLKDGEVLLLSSSYPDDISPPIRDDPFSSSAGREFRRPFYHDRANVQTQGGNIDYGLRQYVSAVEFKAGPRQNPHLARIKSGGAVITLLEHLGSNVYRFEGDDIPLGALPSGFVYEAIHDNGETYSVTYVSSTNLDRVTVTPFGHFGGSTAITSTLGSLTLKAVTRSSGAYDRVEDGVVNQTWGNGYAPGGLRYGDTVWMNMHYTNPHAIEGMFCKSRGVLNEFEVWSGFNGGRGAMAAMPRDSIPMENFLIGDSCIETARNFVQHVNKTIEENYSMLGISNPPTVAFLDPYLSTEQHARVLLYDVEHDREFIAFHDLFMQVQSSQMTPKVNGLDVASGFQSQIRTNDETTAGTLANTNAGGGTGTVISSAVKTAMSDAGRSKFVEGAYAHKSWFLIDQDSTLGHNTTSTSGTNVLTRGNDAYLDYGSSNVPHRGGADRLENSVCSASSAATRHANFIESTEGGYVTSNNAARYRFSSTFFDTPDGTRAIPAFLCLKGKRASALTLTDTRLNNLPQWTELDFVRRLTIDLGEIGVKEGVTDIEAAAREVVRLVNQSGALNGRSNQRRPADQYAGEGERFGITARPDNRAIGVESNIPTDPTATHHHADFSATGSTHDPAPFWDDTAFTSFDRGSHMGYLRAHLGRVVVDADGNEGFSIVIHSTVPGASGRNFCTWLDNSRGQSLYRPQFLIGHGGRFRNFWCMPNEILGENMHPAPMPINKDGRPFAPITTLRELLPQEEDADELLNNLHKGFDSDTNMDSVASSHSDTIDEVSTGRSANTLNGESFEKQGLSESVVEGLRIGTQARSRINFGGLVASGIPGWAPDAGKWGFGANNNGGRFDKIYSTTGGTSYSAHVPTSEVLTDEIGDSSLYGFRFVDHNGKTHTIRFVYRESGKPFVNDKTVLPNTIENETIIFFDDRDIGQGGFTVGKNMKNATYPMGPYDLPDPTWRGNLWRGVRAPENAYACTISVSGTTLTISTLWHDLPTASGLDALGWLGFPDSGLLLVTKPSGTSYNSGASTVLSYTGRTHNNAAGTMTFTGITGETLSSYFSSETGPANDTAGDSPILISPALNQTTIITDELIAAAVEHAMTVDPNGDGVYFDCSELYTSNGRTYGEVMGEGASTAIHIKTFDAKNEVTPLRDLFDVRRDVDWGLYDGSITTTASNGGGSDPNGNDHLGGLSRAEIDAGMRLDVGYLPKTVLNITTRYRGTNANTATPILVDSSNNAVDVGQWRKHLRGELYTRFPGDHILPAIDGPCARSATPASFDSGTRYAYSHGSYSAAHAVQEVGMQASHGIFTFGPLGRYEAWRKHVASTNMGTQPFSNAEDLSFVEKVLIWSSDKGYALAQPLSDYGESNNTHYFGYLYSEQKDFAPSAVTNAYIYRWGDVTNARKFDGVRLAGNTYGEPLTYFRGASDSPDHSVPLYFGGGFSGVVMDINDGTQNDYTTVMSHPYSSGPTGCAGLQNVGENMGSHAIIDTTAIMAMFPGTHALDQHRGEDAPPFSNADALLHTDMSVDTNSHDPSGSGDKNTLYGNTVVTKPIPVVLRFAHPYARYDDAANEVAYVIFGPGQSAPKHFETTVEPSVAATMNSANLSAGSQRVFHVGRTGTVFMTGDTYFTGSALADAKLPNAIKNAALMYLPEALTKQQGFLYPFNYLRNWEPAYGSPRSEYNHSNALHGGVITNHFGAAKNNAGTFESHPYSFYEVSDQNLHGVTSGALYRALFHMDGGCPAGGNWFDNAVRKNPPHPVAGSTVTTQYNTVVTTATGGNTIRVGENATMFRVGALALTAYDFGISESDTPRDVFVVDATRCQNSEEMAAIIAAAINSWPGEGNLKALGGTFLPSFQEASKQDRYAWTHAGQIDNNTGRDLFSDDNSRGYIDVNSIGQLPETFPSQGWLRLLRTSGSTDPEYLYAYYYGYNPTDSRFYLGSNFRTGEYFPEDPTAGSSNRHKTSLSDTYQIFVWTQTGHHRWSNGAQAAIHAQSAPLPVYAASNANPMNKGTVIDALAGTHVHFSGVVDAIDRTRPIGAIGWHGERYSYLNSLLVGNGVGAGLGAWHPALGFNPYGVSTQCHSLNSPSYVVKDNGSDPPDYTYAPKSTSCPTGLHGRHYLVVSYEGELPIVAKADRDGIVLAGDYIGQKWGSAAGTVITSHNNRHNLDRYVAWSNGGPHIDAQVTFTDTAIHSPPTQTYATDNDGVWAGGAGNLTKKMDTCLFPTGDLFFDKDINPGSALHADESLANTVTGVIDALKVSCASGSSPFLTYGDDPNTHTAFKYWASRSAARNFFPEHAVWKRMGGGNLCLPAPNARGLGAVPWVWRKVGGSYVKFGENIYGNVRFSFETTNASMMPVIQAQELAHPQLAEKHPYEVKNALTIPNEELQFLEMEVVDDTGQVHTIEGGSPFGVVIRDFELVSDRDTQGLAPALAGSGNEPNLRIRLPNADTIPGNILVRSGFDKVQGYQHETMGAGGIQRPSLPDSTVLSNFNSQNTTPSNGPFWENEGWERIDSRPDSFPDSRVGDIDSENPLSTSYEPHDRSLYFHVTKVGSTYSTREPLYISGAGVITHDPRTFVSYSGSVLTANGTVSTTVWKQEAIPDGRYFLVVNGFVVSYTNVSGSTFTGCVFPPGFSASNGDTIKPGFYIPAGSTRHFAARRLRDHAEVSGESPDKKNIQWHTVGSTTAPTAVIRGDRLTPMPLPRMGHHYVTPTMAMLPGHLAHPLYQRVYTNAFACASADRKSIEEESGYTVLTTGLTEHANGNDTAISGKDTVGPHALMWFSSLTSAHKPSDIHGDGFTLLFETKLRFDGYGIADGTATCNSTGGHRIQLERGTNYKHQWNFPDPLEVGAYQIVIQPNLFAQQFMGNNANEDFGATGAPSGTVYPTLTDQQVNTVIALQWSGANYDLILAEATMADVRGCEIYLNEMILDIDPAPGQQFTTIPPLASFNPIGVNESSSGAFTRRSLPYRPNMFRKATPGYTVTVPWWSPAIKSSTIYASNPWRKTEHYFPDDYYHFCRSTLGSVGSQITLAGYPTYYLDHYIHEYSSLAPTCTFKRTITAETTADTTKDAVIAVTNNDLFPLVGRDYWNHKLSYVDSTGRTHTATYSSRGYASGEATTTTNRFIGVSANADFWSNISDGTVLRLTGAYGTLAHSEVFTQSDRSVATRNLPQLLSGTRDTNTLHTPDAYLCFWHYNLGRPMTYYSDSRTNIHDAAVDKSPYNHLPEHFEMVHYHDFVYAMSDGPFDFRAKHWDQAGGAITDPNDFNASYPHQAHTDSFPGSNKKYHFGSYWPGGSRFGAHMSDLTLWGTAGPGWGKYWDDLTVYKDSGSDGSSVTTVNASTLTLQNQGFGYRFGLRQPFNRPRWAIWATAALTDPYANTHSGYHPGPFIQSDSQTTTSYVEGSSSASTTTATTATTHTGVLERTTNAAAMTGSDLKIQQVRYSHGRRMTKPYGCAVRNIVNPNTVIPAHQGDTNTGSLASTTVANQRRNLAIAVTHYVVDWWGNTTGEEVRRFPVRGFAIRPSWDPEDAYRATDRTKTAQVFAAPSVDSRATRDLFDPATAKRVGDRGDGRGVRWPTVFNEDVLQSMDTIRPMTGHVLSHHTSQPPADVGFIRSKNTDLAADELKRGISRTLDVHSDDGLLKPEAMAGSNIERTKESLAPANEFLQDPISRSSPRIGLDAMTTTEFNNGIGNEFVAVSSEAHSLHTDRPVGRRYIVASGIKTDTRAVADYDLTQLNFSSFKQVMRLNMTHGLWPMGGTLILDLMNYMEPISDAGWGSSSGDSANPYQTDNHNPLASGGTRTNTTDKLLRLLVRPVRVLDHRHIEIFRDQTNALSGTAGGKYGVFTYDAPNARASTGRFVRSTNPSPTNPPYAPTYLFATTDYAAPTSSGPVIPGSEVTGFTQSLRQTVARIVTTANTLQHFRGDASRRQSTSEEGVVYRNDFSTQPRYTQSVYPGDKQNTSTHSGESDHTDSRVLP